MIKNSFLLIIMVSSIITVICVAGISQLLPKANSEEEHPCLIFADGKHALVAVGHFESSMSWGGMVDYCKGQSETLKWLFSIGYNVTQMSQVEILLER